MKSLSRVIKKDFVLYDTDPRVINPYNVSAQGSGDGNVGNILTKNALESADATLKSAFNKAEEIKSRSIVDAHITYTRSKSIGRLKGHEEGLQKGCEEGKKKAAESVRSAVDDFLAKACSLDMKYYGHINKEKSDCVEFAFGLAETVLGIKINSGGEEFKKLVDGFLSVKPEKVSLALDGGVYPFQTLQTEGVLSCAEGLQGISLCAEKEEDSEAEDAIKAQEAMPKTEMEPDSIECEKQIEENAGEIEEEQNADSQIQQAENNELSNDESCKNDVADPDMITEENEETDSSDENSEAFDADAESAQEYAQDEAAQTIDEDTAQNDEENDEENDEMQNNGGEEDRLTEEKFVFVRPARKKLILSKNNGGDTANLKFEDLPEFLQSNLKLLIKKADMKDITAALSGADEGLSEMFLNAMPRRNRQKVTEALKYLGPIPEQEADSAKKKLILLAEKINIDGRDDADD